MGGVDFRRMIEEQVENEKRATELLYESIKKAKNEVIRLFLYQLALDSAKHEKMLNVILNLIDDPSKAELLGEEKDFEKAVEKHVEIERKMLEDFRKLAEETRNKLFKFILQEIVSDERRHHAVIKRIYQILREKEKVKKEKWWDFLFRYSSLTG